MKDIRGQNFRAETSTAACLDKDNMLNHRKQLRPSLFGDELVLYDGVVIEISRRTDCEGIEGLAMLTGMPKIFWSLVEAILTDSIAHDQRRKIWSGD